MYTVFIGSISPPAPWCESRCTCLHGHCSADATFSLPYVACDRQLRATVCAHAHLFWLPLLRPGFMQCLWGTVLALAVPVWLTLALLVLVWLRPQGHSSCFFFPWSGLRLLYLCWSGLRLGGTVLALLHLVWLTLALLVLVWFRPRRHSSCFTCVGLAYACFTCVGLV